MDTNTVAEMQAEIDALRARLVEREPYICRRYECDLRITQAYANLLAQWKYEALQESQKHCMHVCITCIHSVLLFSKHKMTCSLKEDQEVTPAYTCDKWELRTRYANDRR